MTFEQPPHNLRLKRTTARHIEMSAQPPAPPLDEVSGPAGSTHAAEEPEQPNQNTAAAVVAKTTKRKVAIYFGYVGENYSGLQWNFDPRHPTIEAELIRALYSAGLITAVNMSIPTNISSRISYERASRTDKGVHALKNLCSLRVQLPGGGDDWDERAALDDAVSRLNSLLPTEDIRVYHIESVTTSFNSYQMCNGRRYHYYLPTFALMTREEFDAFISHEDGPEFVSVSESDAPWMRRSNETAPVVEESDAQKEAKAAKRERIEQQARAKAAGKKRARDGNGEGAVDAEESAGPGPNGGKGSIPGSAKMEPMHVFKDIPEGLMKKLSHYRLPAANLERARSLFKLYEGTRSFHNFTPGGKASDPAAMRFMQSVTVSDPMVVHPSLEKPTLQGLAKEYRGDKGVMPAHSLDDLSAETRAMLTTDSATAKYLEGEENAELRAKYEAHMAAVYGSGVEFVRVDLEGQSFMLNQIRKMVGAVVSAMALGLPDRFVDDCMSKHVSRGIPMAPANGLFLSYLAFDRYNHRLGRIQGDGDNGAGKEAIDMDLETVQWTREGVRKLVESKKQAARVRIIDVQRSQKRPNFVEPPPVGPVTDEEVDAEFRVRCEKRKAMKEAVDAMHRRIVATVCRREVCEDITGRWMRSLRHVARLAFRMHFSPAVRYVATIEEARTGDVDGHILLTNMYANDTPREPLTHALYAQYRSKDRCDAPDTVHLLDPMLMIPVTTIHSRTQPDPTSQ